MRLWLPVGTRVTVVVREYGSRRVLVRWSEGDRDHFGVFPMDPLED
jgi:hypothetical protein